MSVTLIKKEDLKYICRLIHFAVIEQVNAIDEISMVTSGLLDSIDKQCKLLKNLDPNSTAIFGGLPMVFLLGDFHQFPPIQSKTTTMKNGGNNYGICSRTLSSSMNP
jgi:hypothetical protein